MGLQAFWHIAESCIRSNPPTLTCHKHCKFGAPESLELSGVPMVPIDVTLVVVVVVLCLDLATVRADLQAALRWCSGGFRLRAHCYMWHI